MWSRIALLTLVVSFGCSSTVKPSVKTKRIVPRVQCPKLSVPTELANISVQIDLDDRTVPVFSGDALLSGDKIDVTMKSEAGAHLYVLAGSDPATATLLFPFSPEARAEPSAEFSLELDDTVGDETLWLVASKHKLTAAEAVKIAASAKAEPSDELVFERAAQKKQQQLANVWRSRGLEVEESDAGKLQTVSIRGDTGAIRLDLKHRAADQLRSFAFKPKVGSDAVALDRSLYGELANSVDFGDATSPIGLARRIGLDYPPGTAVLLYAHEGDWLSTFVLDCRGMVAQSRVRISAAQLDRLVDDLRGAVISDPDIAGRGVAITKLDLADQPKSLKQVSGELESVLFAADIRQALERVEHAIVVPIRSLGTVPFSMLCPFPDGTCIVDRMSVSISPSLFDLFVPVTPWKWGFTKPLILGNPTFKAKREFSQLPGAELEARSVARLLKRTALIGDQATPEAFWKAIQSADFVYLATHALAHETEPMTKSFILLAGGESERITPMDIQRHHRDEPMNAKLVVLSACQTGLGGVQLGGVVGITRAMQVSGAERVVMSQWKIDDAATRTLMEGFVSRLPDHPPAEALRLAMLALRKEHPEPAYWAPFTLFGSSR